MAEFVAIRDGGKTNEEGAFRVISKAFNQEAVLGDTDWQVTENSPTPDASIDLALGDGIIQKDGYLFHGWATAKVDITIAANSSGDARIDAIAAYIDLAVVSSASNNNPGALKFKNVQGTPAGSPVAPTDGEIQTSVGGSNPFLRLAEIAVADGFSAINDGNITDKRTWLAFTSADQTLQYDSITSTWKLTDKLDIATSITTPIVNTDAVSEDTPGNGVPVDGLLIKDKTLQRFTEGDNDFVASGGVWTADSVGSTLLGSMTAIVVYIGGVRVAVSAVTAKAFTASKDTYVDVGSDGVIDYNEAANNAASLALAADHIRIGIVITDGTSINDVDDINQGQVAPNGPTVSSVVLSVTDTLGNLIYNRNPSTGLIGYKEIVANQGSITSSDVDITGLAAPVIVPAGKKIKITVSFSGFSTTVANDIFTTKISEGATTLTSVSNIIDQSGVGVNGGTREIVLKPSSGLHTYKIVAIRAVGSGTGTFRGATDAPAFISVEII